MKYFFLIFICTCVLVVSFAGLRGHKFRKTPIEVFPDMDRQAKVGEQQPSNFFADGVASRKPVDGTVPMGYAVPVVPASSPDAKPQAFAFTQADDYYNTGRFGDFWGDGMPEEVEVTEALLARGMERYQIFCAPCHGSSGDGQGITARYGMGANANLHLPQFSDPSADQYRVDGWMFNTITHGNGGLMGPYGASITVRDRWAIVAYVRALQASVKMPVAEVQSAFEAGMSAAEEAAAEPEQPGA